MNGLPIELTTTLITLTASIIGATIALFLNRRIRTYQLLESGARADLSLNINVLPSVLTINENTSILETRIEIQNNSRKKCCIPAVYVSARALVKKGLEKDYLGESDFDKLYECGELSRIRNVAGMESTVIQLAPDEIERFVRWDTLDKSFLDQYPVVVVNVEVISVPSELIGEDHFPKFKQGKYRLEWLGFMNENGGARHTYIITSRWRPSESNINVPIKAGNRYLRLPETFEPDIPNTQKFKPLLEQMVQWSRHVTVDL